METTLETNPFIPFTSDYGFKVTFGNEANTLFLRRALQALIESDKEIITITFDKTLFEGITPDSRSGIFDMSCTDESGNHFIVEMQLAAYPEMLQRMKFYGLQKLNTLVQKGNYQYKGLPKIYCVGIMGDKISDEWPEYHEPGCIRSKAGRVMDEQMQFIMVQLGKFTKTAELCHTDLDKLIYTMKALSTEESKPIEYPTFWTEEWLKTAIQELDTRAMSAEKRLAYTMVLSANAAAVYQEQEKVAAAKAEGIAEGEAKGKAEGIAEGEARGIAEGEARAKAAAEAEKYAIKKEAIRRLQQRNFTDEDIADTMQETVTFVRAVKAEIMKEATDNNP